MEEEKKEKTEEEVKEEEEKEEEAAAEVSEEAEEGEKDKFGRTLYTVKCSECGKEAQVPFKPSGDRPVYCRECYQKRKPKRF
ncbi:MAG: hypothetical protein GTN76_11450 [Candidatus Aenigmarchaeota archaeon]|nr:hypothetical protein [Candidatus Aenigmarchaeota archaeon]NIQ18043.1 hypothetical protein [Candidatus Aenigmarchaeota archaeon]